MSVRGTVVCAMLMTLGTPTPAQEECPPGNLISGARLITPWARAQVDLLTRPSLARGGALPNVANSVKFGDPNAMIAFDLGVPRPLRAFAIQADGDDVYLIEGSLDGASWQQIWAAQQTGPGGLRVRQWMAPDSTPARYIRVRGLGGDGSYAVSRWDVRCQDPVAARQEDERRLTTAESKRLKLIVALLALAVFGSQMLLGKRARGRGFTRFRDGALIGLGLIGGLLWWNLGSFNLTGYVHHHDFYHYYMGAKYSPELGYTGLYECTLIADAQDGIPGAKGRHIRNLRTNVVEDPAELLARPERCTSGFSEQRWSAFKSDNAWFRSNLTAFKWRKIGRDHGYNATPVWELAGGAFARLGSPATDKSILALALLDPILLVIMWICVAWAFGWRATCVALLWWGTNNVSGFGWNGGAFLRQDWLVFSVVGIALVRRGKMAAGGFALTYATLARLIPGLIVAGLVLKVLARSLRERRLALSSEHRRFAIGCVAAVILLVPLTLILGGSSWPAFLENSRTHIGTPSVNKVGLDVLLSYESETRLVHTTDPSSQSPDEEWRKARERVGERRGWLRVLLVTGFLILLWRSLRDVDDWVALVLATGLIAIVSSQSSYYFSIFLVYGLFWCFREARAAVPLVALAAVTLLCESVWAAPVEIDVRHVAISAAMVIFVVLMTGQRWVTRRPE